MIGDIIFKTITFFSGIFFAVGHPDVTGILVSAKDKIVNFAIQVVDTLSVIA